MLLSKYEKHSECKTVEELFHPSHYTSLMDISYVKESGRPHSFIWTNSYGLLYANFPNQGEDFDG